MTQETDTAASAPSPDSLIENRRKLAAHLGHRARLRRIECEMTRTDLVAKVGGMSQANLQSYEGRLPLEVLSIEGAWEGALGVPSGWLRNQFMDPTPADFEHDSSLETAPHPSSPPKVTDNALVNEILHLCALGSGDCARTADVMAYRYGLRSTANGTSDDVCWSLNMAPSQLEGIDRQFRARLATVSPSTPEIDSLRSEIEVLLPATVASLDNALREKLGPDLSVSHVARFCEAALKRSLLEVQDGHLGSVVLPSGAKYETLGALHEAVSELLQASGAASVNYLAGACVDESNLGSASPSVITKWCRVMPGFEWLDESNGWFWLGPEVQSPVHCIALQILSVAGDRVDVHDVREGLERERQRPAYATSAPVVYDLPTEVLEVLLSQHQDIVRVHRHPAIRPRTVISPGQVLEDQQLALYEVLESRHGVARIEDVSQALAGSFDMTVSQANTLLRWSPILVDVTDGVVALRGRPLNPEAYARACAPVPVQRAWPSGSGRLAGTRSH